MCTLTIKLYNCIIYKNSLFTQYLINHYLINVTWESHASACKGRLNGNDSNLTENRVREDTGGTYPSPPPIPLPISWSRQRICDDSDIAVVHGRDNSALFHKKNDLETISKKVYSLHKDFILLYTPVTCY